ncbi:response regulator transcription factor [Patescibacteria group bacterium]|nr:response regulator transcription factor [Patescibacteria group bacterium]
MTERPHILLLEDHQPTAQTVQWLLRHRYSVTHAPTCQAAERFLAEREFELLIIDLQLPDGSGAQFCEPTNFHRHPPSILVLSGITEVSTKVNTLTAGADDYLTKPFSAAELNARVATLLRRAKVWDPQELSLGNIVFSPEESSVRTADDVIHLTRLENELLTVLLRHRDQVVRKARLLDTIWGEAAACGNVLEAQIKNLRKKLPLLAQGCRIETIYGIGYRLNTKYA